MRDKVMNVGTVDNDEGLGSLGQENALFKLGTNPP